MHRLCLWSTVNGPHILLTHGTLDKTGMAIVCGRQLHSVLQAGPGTCPHPSSCTAVQQHQLGSVWVGHVTVRAAIKIWHAQEVCVPSISHEMH
jgi:hypothetical protein